MDGVTAISGKRVVGILMLARLVVAENVTFRAEVMTGGKLT
jgi:hypothetical protein